MPTITLDYSKLPPEVRAAKQATFPGYNGHKYQVRLGSSTVNVADYWSGGSRSFFAVVAWNSAAGAFTEAMHIPQQSAFDRKLPGAEAVKLLPGIIVVEHQIFCGKDMGLTFHTAGTPQWLPAPVELTHGERMVLTITSSLKSFARQEERERKGMTLEEWNSAKQSLQARKLLNKAGAISVTTEGRNARS